MSAADFEAAQQKLSLQSNLHAKVVLQLREYPPTGLFDNEAVAVDGTTSSSEAEAARVVLFTAFLRDLRNTLARSPRNDLLGDLRSRFEAALDDEGGSMAALYAELGLERGAGALEVEAAVAAVPPSRIYERWKVECAAAAKPVAVPGLMEKIRKGLAQKAAARGAPLPSEEEIAARLEAVQAGEEATRRGHAEEAQALLERLPSDPQHQRWARVRRLWQDSGAEGLLMEYHTLDQAHGEERRHHGGCFEERHTRLAVAMLVKRWLHQRPRSEGIDFAFYCGATWHDARQKPVGEIDAVVTCTRCGEEVVIAIVEMKAGWFDLPVALRIQHAGKLAESEQGRGTTIWATGRELRLNARDDFAWVEPPQRVGIFAATLIPEHRFVLGVEPRLLPPICQALYGTPGGLTGGAGQGRLDLGDAEACAGLLQSLREDPSLRPRLALSARGLFEGPLARQRVLVLEDRSDPAP